jgi:hypothetical protein
MASNKNNKKISYEQAKSRSFWPLFLFLVFIILIVGGWLIYKYWVKQNYYSSISSFVFTSSTGPVAPEYQSTKTLTITPNGCSYEIKNSTGTDTQNCTLSNSNYNKLVNLYYSSDIGTKISYNNNSASKQLVGGPVRKFTVNFANGSSSTTVLSTDFKSNAQNFFDNVSGYISQFNELNF